MGWFEDQISLRKESDRAAFEESCLQIAGSVMGRNLTEAFRDERDHATDAISEILKYYHAKNRDIPDSIRNLDDVLEYVLRPSGIMTRDVVLKEGWRKDAAGAMLATIKKDGMPVALIPSGMKGYVWFNSASGKKEKVRKDTEKLFDRDAIVFYKPLPDKKLGIGDFFRYILHDLDRWQMAAFFIFALLSSLLGLLIPYLSKSLFSDVIPSESQKALMALAIFMICASVGRLLFSTFQELILKNVSLSLSMRVESAVMMRILTLPSSFFKDYSSGELGNRVFYLTALVEGLVDMGFAGFVTAIFSLLYIIQIFSFTPALALPALIIFLLVLIVNAVTVAVKSVINTRQMELASKEKGLSYAFVSGIEKIRLSGAERRAFAKWGQSYARQAEIVYNPPIYIKIAPVITKAILLGGMIVLYYKAIHAQVSVPDYYAFNAAFGVVTGTLAALDLIIEPAAMVRPILEMVRPITETLPQRSEDKHMVETLSGAIELNNVSFRYSDDMPYVLNNISLKIRPGQYVAITGKTGCGKSTLMRILMGFETPQRGAVYYDGRDLSHLDLKSVRSNIGTVLQNSQLFSGDIYSNIVISAPHLTLQDAWEAAEMAGIADDIRAMPMNMFTYIPEGGGTFSGGQKQRLIIARAIASKPKILMFDEATSALDNITQKQVSDSLDSLNCTRIVIAHRLSTIRHCDRIIVLDGGRIVEDGNYEELMARKGFFSELVKRQQVETTD